MNKIKQIETHINLIMNNKQALMYDKLLKKCNSVGVICLDIHYTHNKDPIKFQCKTNKDHQFDRHWHSFRSLKGCPLCIRNTPEKGKASLTKRLNDIGYRQIGEYTVARDKVLIEHISCGHRYKVFPSAFGHRYLCPICHPCLTDRSEKAFHELAITRKFMIVDKYRGVDIHTYMICPNSHLIRITPASFKAGGGCGRCATNCPIKAEKNFRESAANEGYEVLGDYVNSATPISVLCRLKHPWNVSPDTFKQLCRCPNCPRRVTKGEECVSKVLDSMNIEYIPQYRVKEDYRLSTRKYDFYFMYEGRKYLLEWDGRQHREFTGIFHDSEDDLLDSQRIDRLKTFVAMECGYSVIRLDDRQMKNIQFHLNEALKSDKQLYLSDELIYRYIDKGMYDDENDAVEIYISLIDLPVVKDNKNKEKVVIPILSMFDELNIDDIHDICLDCNQDISEDSILCLRKIDQVNLSTLLVTTNKSNNLGQSLTKLPRPTISLLD